MKNNHVFFDVDCIEITPNKVKFNCPERSQPISEELFEIYSLISAIVAPLVFTIHEDGFQPMEDDKRDFVFIPANKEKVEWKKSIGERYKFYLERGNKDGLQDVLVFNSNENTAECVKKLRGTEWIVFGVGLENKVDHVVTELLKMGKKVRYIPELIINESAYKDGEVNLKLVYEYFAKWESLGAYPITYNEVLMLIKKNKMHK